MANIGVAAIRAEQAGGSFDEFDYPKAATLPTATWVYSKSGGANIQDLGPDGAGYLIYDPAGTAVGPGDIKYLLKASPHMNTTGSVTAVVSKAPGQNVALPAHAYIYGKASLTDKACIRASISKSFIELEVLNAAGTVTATSKFTVTTNGGESYSLKWDATDMWITRNGIEVGRRAHTGSVNDGTHATIGLGVMVPSYTVLLPKNNPVPHFAGIAWHP